MPNIPNRLWEKLNNLILTNYYHYYYYIGILNRSFLPPIFIFTDFPSRRKHWPVHSNYIKSLHLLIILNYLITKIYMYCSLSLK